MSYTALPHVASGDLATSALHNILLDDLAIVKTPITDDGRINGEVLRFYDNVQTVAAAATITLDLSLGNWWIITLGANITTINITNWQTLKGVPIIIEFKQDGSGGHTVAGWPAALKGDGGSTTPTINTTANHTTMLTLASRDTGATIWWNYFISNGS